MENRINIFILGSRRAPAIDPLGILRTHINTAVAHGHPEVIVPIGAVNGNARGWFKIRYPWNSRQLVSFYIKSRDTAITHMHRRALVLNDMIPFRSIRWDNAGPFQGAGQAG